MTGTLGSRGITKNILGFFFPSRMRVKNQDSGQIRATSHDTSKGSWGFGKWEPLISGKSILYRLVKSSSIWPDGIYETWVSSPLPGCWLVTTRITTFSVGNPNLESQPLVKSSSIWPGDYHLQTKRCLAGAVGPFWGSQLSLKLHGCHVGRGIHPSGLGWGTVDGSQIRRENQLRER